MEVCRDDKEEDVSTYWMTLRKRKNTRNWRGNTRSRSVEESIWKSPWTCRKRDHRMKQPRQEQSPDAFHTVFPASSDLRNNTLKYSRKKGHRTLYIWPILFTRLYLTFYFLLQKASQNIFQAPTMFLLSFRVRTCQKQGMLYWLPNKYL